MRTFKDLYIDVTDSSVENFIDSLTVLVGDYALWTRRADLEERDMDGRGMYAFQRQEGSELPAAGLSIVHHKDDVWYVPNVVPLEYGNLTIQQYNDVLTEFHDLFLLPVSDEQGLKITFTSEHISDADILGEEGARLLKAFSSGANKSTGSSHPCDRERWLAFITTVCATKNVDTNLLDRVLQEQGWDEEGAQDLVVQFEFAKDLIDYMRK